MNRQELLDALLVERYGNNEWWTRKTPAEEQALDDSDMATARRRRVLLEACDERGEETA